MKLSFAPSTSRYTLLEKRGSSKGFQWSYSGLRLPLFIILISCALVATFGFGFILGKSSSTRSFVIPVSTSRKEFTYDRNFSYPPNNMTNASWESLFPKRGGFFSHPPVVSNRSTLSIFHQLHCLDAIRHAYWGLHDAATKVVGISDNDLPKMTSPSHIRHCVDLLRQSLMCAADQTIEVKDDKGGVSGFGTVHQCYDYAALVKTVERWQEMEQIAKEP